VARILQVCNTDFYLTRFLTPLVQALVTQGHTVECVCEGGERVNASILGPDVRVHPFIFPQVSSPWPFAQAVAKMRQLIRTGHYDCVNGHNRNASIVARVAAWLEGVPVNLYTAHGFYFHDDQSSLARMATIRLEASLARITDFTLSQSTEDVAVMTAPGYIPAHRIATIGNGIDTTRFHSRHLERNTLETVLGLRSGVFRVASTGRLVQGKGFSDLLAAFAQLRHDDPTAELLLIGGNIAQDISPYQAEFLAQARSLGVSDALVVTGITDRVEDYLATCDVFVLPSYREGLPRALLEAMATEIAVVATNIRGCREAITHGENGYLFPPHDVASLVTLLRRLREDPSLRTSLGKKARARVSEKFDERDYVARQVQAIERLVGRVNEQRPFHS
jgi:glycosyltransferase involved in cell wall biosynthesis